ncbi:putative uncharacterized protein DDB_G0286333 isoform X2 [Folsomia candida]|uniref:Uncharacterized protein n=1 Tax=Folsomia candida TaxID=158441 RepID=A0A226E2C3_FOLCA|nr:putative uncharacterized protein DDB_G0286333 isoform X2 [Folsomia candida]OXA51713.1 hypothetical protein Fcan01_13380 [Folsomia candida]
MDHFPKFYKLFRVALFLSLSSWSTPIMAQQQQQFPFGQSFPNQYQSFGNQNPSSSSPTQFDTSQKPSPNQVPNYNNFLGGFPSSWPFGQNGNGANGGGLSNNPWQALFPNSPFNNQNQNSYENNNNQNNQVSKPSQGQNEGQMNSPQQQQQQQYQAYPFGFPFSFFPQYARPQASNEPNKESSSSSNPTNNNNNDYISRPNTGLEGSKIRPSGSSGDPVELEVVHSKQDSKHPSLNWPIRPPQTPPTFEDGPSQQTEDVDGGFRRPSSGGNNNGPRPVELEVVHSKQDSKHPSLMTSTLSPPLLEEDPENNFDGYSLDPEVVDVRLTDSLSEKSKNQNSKEDEKSISSDNDALLFQ